MEIKLGAGNKTRLIPQLKLMKMVALVGLEPIFSPYTELEPEVAQNK